MSALAKELGISAKDALAMLNEMGEYVESASSTIEAPTVARLRERCGERRPSAQQPPSRDGWTPSVVRDPRRNDPYQDLGRTEIDHRQMADGPVRALTPAHRPTLVPRRRPRREWWRGADPSDFTRYILDMLIVPRRDEDASVPRPPYQYFEDEVKEAQSISSKWSVCMLAGLDYDVILDWRETLDGFTPRSWFTPPSVGSPDHAIALHAAGIKPADLGWRYGDETAGTLPERLARGEMTVDEVILEAKYRRGDAV